jgi:hypothetical protein
VSIALLRYRRIYDVGCLCCRRKGWFSPCQVHHLNADGKAGQKRRGDVFTIGLCPWHHVGEPLSGMTEAQCRARFGPSLKSSRAFREAFGTDDSLLAEQNRLIEREERNLVGRKLA